MAPLLVLSLGGPAAGVPRSAPPGGAAAEGTAARRAAGGGARPNIVVVLADDLDRTELNLFPNLARLRREGTSLTNFIVSDSWCCPSRSTILRSQYVHSHRVLTNNPPNGGFPEFYARGLDRSTVGTWLRSAGYRTGLIGKFLNGYPNGASPTYVPPGWDDWRVPAPRRMYRQRDYQLVERGVLVPYGSAPEDHLDDVLTSKAVSFVRETPKAKPFFLYLAPVAPHLPAASAARHAGAFATAKVPRTPSFNRAVKRTGTAGLTDEAGDGATGTTGAEKAAPGFGEPRWISGKPKLSAKDIKRIDAIHRDRLRSMLSVDDMVGAVMKSLRDTGRLQNTYIFFTSDNGFHLGQHRLQPGKTTPFEEDIRVPMLVRGPGVPAGGTSSALAGTVDLAPTFARLAGARVPPFAEGRPLTSLLRGRERRHWRRAMLVEFFAGKAKQHPEGPDCDTRVKHARGCPLPPTYAALRTGRYTYVEYATGERQLFDLATDPYQLHNLVADPALAGKGRSPRADRIRARLHRLSAWLERYRRCAGASCRKADRR
ncbi:sulfatase [Spirillospora sp. NPDC048911]|uniref:sulfatase family protein n=1 Tax=Spirillospora sp. NPDC048911 TaxID=3364527 RepID=UPI00371734F1